MLISTPGELSGWLRLDIAVLCFATEGHQTAPVLFSILLFCKYGEGEVERHP